ncbi:hypothetical protein ACWIF8_26555 [Micromonospora chalcea]
MIGALLPAGMLAGLGIDAEPLEPLEVLDGRWLAAGGLLLTAVAVPRRS